VFFNDAFVPDDDVVGPVDGGWTVTRATLGNESVSIGGGRRGMSSRDGPPAAPGRSSADLAPLGRSGGHAR